MKRLIAICVVVGLILATSSARANTTTSSTMWFEGGLEYNSSTGVYTGTIDATEGYYYVAGGPGTTWDPADNRWETPDGHEAEGGFDVYAKEGGTAYVEGMSPDTWIIGPDHDAWPAQKPDVTDYWNYELILTETTWAVRGFDYSDAYAGTIDWSTMIATETGANWNPTWPSGEENVPLQYSTFAVSIIDSGGESPHECTVSLTPVVPAPGAILLGSIGVCLVGWLHRRRTL